MNVRRGLFRAWALVSVLWIGAVTVFSAPLIGRYYAPDVKVKGSPTNETTKIITGPRTPNFYNYVASPSAEKLTVEFDRSAKPITNENFFVVLSLDGKLYIPAGYNETDRDYIVEQFQQQYWSRRMTDVALFGVVPCVVLFVLGYVLPWVARGLRSA